MGVSGAILVGTKNAICGGMAKDVFHDKSFLSFIFSVKKDIYNSINKAMKQIDQKTSGRLP